MNLSQKRFFLTMQKLEAIETAFVGVMKKLDTMNETLRAVDEAVCVLDYRLLFAGRALLGKDVSGFSEQIRKEYNASLDAT